MSELVPGTTFSAARRARRPRSGTLGVVAATALIVAACSAGPELSSDGPGDGELLNAEQLASATIVVTADTAEPDPELFAEATVEHDGRDVTDAATREDGELRYPLADLDDGDHEVTVDVPGGGTQTFSFSVDATPPELEITDPEDGVVFGDDPLTLAGSTDPDATLTIDGDEVTVEDDGAYEHTYDEVPDAPIALVATDLAGNTTEQQLELTRLPSRVQVDEVRAVHVTPHAWATPSFRERVLKMFDDGLINAIQLDLKDEGGRIGYVTEVP
ncbi:MAG: putative glycoside hydrolase, partial [Nitriliruptor sp.]|uniref:putative glycoside hydrolase n=1 Tax=Nitriliruptor sp. TaxID=2448056 RepID=UPI0034A0AB96